MKNLKLIALVLAMSISTLSFATTTNENPTNKLRQQIIEMLGKSIDKIADKKVEAEVVFTVNNKSEIVIISVNSENSSIEAFVKNRLNNKKINFDTTNKEKIYHLPLSIVNE